MHTLSSFLLTVSVKANSLLLLSMTQTAQDTSDNHLLRKIAILLMTPVGVVMIPQNLGWCFQFAFLKT